MRPILLTLSLIITGSLSAQFGLTGSVNFNESQFATSELSEQEINDFAPGVEAAGHYWFRLPKKRLEFQPTLYYATAEREMSGSRLTEYGFQFKTNLYPFDFGTDCNCPTFGKQGPSLQKGFFLQLAPGYAFYSDDWTATAGGETTKSSGFTLTGAVGIDFGVSNLLTITPIAGLRYGFADYAEVRFTDINGQAIGTTGVNLITYQVGLQATFRLDKRRY